MVRSYTLATRPHFLRDIVRTTTDAEGRYRLTGMPNGIGNRIIAIPGGDLPYPARGMDVPDSPGLDPVTVDIDLRRGVWIEGKITDKATGRPLKSGVEYFALFNNPNLADYPGFDGAMRPFEGVRAGKDGSYRLAALPGPGLIAALRRDPYLAAPDRDDEYGVNEDSMRTAPYHLSFTSNYSALARINPAKGVVSSRQDVTLDPGWTITGVLLDPDGRPLAGAFGMGVGQLKTAEFTMRGYSPRRSRELVFRHAAKGLIGLAPAPMADGGSVSVTLRPGASITGRLVATDRHPQADVALSARFRRKDAPIHEQYSTEPIRTDREGRFRIEALPPGYGFELWLSKGDKLLIGDGLRWGQTTDLGDVWMGPRGD
jgi:hypothetical protein